MVTFIVSWELFSYRIFYGFVRDERELLVNLSCHEPNPWGKFLVLRDWFRVDWDLRLFWEGVLRCFGSFSSMLHSMESKNSKKKNLSILSNFQFCPVFNFVQFSILSNFQFWLIFNFVRFSVLYNFPILYNFQFVHFSFSFFTCLKKQSSLFQMYVWERRKNSLLSHPGWWDCGYLKYF